MANLNLNPLTQAMTDLANPVLSVDPLLTRTNDTLQLLLQQWTQVPTRLHQATTYVITAGGKRLRPLLVYCTGITFNASLESLDAAACAVELIHTYSLVHDDLPAMDNDDLRRGNPTCHIAFDEATAILVGDALQCLAFELLSAPKSCPLPAERRTQLIMTLCQASGGQGMAGGQILDLQATGTIIDIEHLAKIHRLKTGELIKASILMGGLCAQVSPETLVLLDRFSQHLGLAYQIHDDILDVEATTEQLGKTQGADQQLNKATYPSIVGLEQAKYLRDQQAQAARDILNELDKDTALLNHLVDKIIQRNY